jgi:hypothetical protein
MGNKGRAQNPAGVRVPAMKRGAEGAVNAGPLIREGEGVWAVLLGCAAEVPVMMAEAEALGDGRGQQEVSGTTGGVTDDVVFMGVSSLPRAEVDCHLDAGDAKVRKRRRAAAGWCFSDSNCGEFLADQDLPGPGAWYRVKRLVDVSAGKSQQVKADLEKTGTNGACAGLEVWVEQEAGSNDEKIELWSGMRQFVASGPEAAGALLSRWQVESAQALAEPPLAVQQQTVPPAAGQEGVGQRQGRDTERHSGTRETGEVAAARVDAVPPSAGQEEEVPRIRCDR